MTASRAVYTALTGGHEQLREQPVARDSDVPFICFTDDPDLRSDSWDVRLVQPLLELDPVRSSRALKITGHPDLEEYDETLWIDARVRLKLDPSLLLDQWLDDGSRSWDIAMPRHSFRVDVVGEFEAVLLTGLEDSSRIYEQLTHYATAEPELLEAPVPWTGMVARRHTADVERAMREWLLHVLRYTRRDQLSVTHALARTGVAARSIAIDNASSDVHEWPPGVGRSNRAPIFRVADSLQPPVARIGQLQHELERLTAETVIAIEKREQRIGVVEAALARTRAELARKQARLEMSRETVQKLRDKLRQQESRSS